MAIDTTIDEILAGLFLSGYEPAYNAVTVREKGVTHILKVARESTFRNVTPTRTFAINGFLAIDVRDRSFERMYPYFKQIAAFIRNAHANGGVVLVHCQMGVSRSVTAVLAHLMINHRMNLAHAYDVVAAARGRIKPTNTFVVELRMLERDLFGNNLEVRPLRISYDDKGQAHALDWKYSLRELHKGWKDQQDFIEDPTNERYELTTGMYKLVRDKLREAARTNIPRGEAVGHLRDVILAWYRTPYAHRGGRAILFRILWRALLQNNIMSRNQLSAMLATIFTSIEWQYFRNTEVGGSHAHQYAAELTSMVNTWDMITFPLTEVQDLRLFVAFRTKTLQVVEPHTWNWTDELHLADATSLQILLYYCCRYGKDKEQELGVVSGIKGVIWSYYKQWEQAQVDRTVTKAVEALGVD